MQKYKEFAKKVVNLQNILSIYQKNMSCILNIETSTDVCSVAISEDGKCIYKDEDRTGPNHNERLGTFVDNALSFADSHAIPVDAVAVSMGPGSYTGLRIGVSMAKGVCYGFGIPLIAVPTLELMCVPVLLREEFSGADAGFDQPEDAPLGEPLLCPMLDARRMEVYSAVYTRALKPVREIRADVVTEETYRELLDKHPVYFFGNGAEKCMPVINHPNAHYIPGIEPLARNMMPIAERRLMRGETEDVAYFVPFYLKDFVALKPKKLL